MIVNDFKKISIYVGIIILSLFMILFGKGVKAYEYPTNSLYFEYTDETMGQVKLYFSPTSIQNLSYEEGEPYIINIGSSTVYGYFSYEGTDYRLTFPVFDVPYVRLDGDSYNQYTYMNIESIVDTNIDFIDNTEMYLVNDTNYKNIMLYCTLFGGLILCLIWLKR